jgi:hypothetical protein
MVVRRSERKRRGQRGSAIIEAALVTPVFFMLIFGIMEFGMALRNYLAVSNATTEGARSASVLGRDREADFFVLQSIADGIEAMGLENVDYVVVFEADKINGAVPDACRTSSVDGLCNRYTRSDFFLALEDAVGNSTGNWGCGAAAVDRYWCPIDNTNNPGGRLAALADPPDFIGVHIQATHSYITGFFGSSVSLTNTKIIRVEPERLN